MPGGRGGWAGRGHPLGDRAGLSGILYVEDAAKATVLASEHYNPPEPVNLGSGTEISIKELVGLIAELTGFKGRLVWDTTKPDGQPRRCLDTTRAEQAFGFHPQTNFREGLRRTIAWNQEHRSRGE